MPKSDFGSTPGVKRRRIDDRPCTTIRPSTRESFYGDDEPCYYSQETQDTLRLATTKWDERVVVDSFKESHILDERDLNNEQDLLDQQNYLALVDQLSDKENFSCEQDLMDLEHERNFSGLLSVSSEGNSFDEQVILDKARRNPLYRRHIWHLLARYKTPAPQRPAKKTPCKLPGIKFGGLAREIYSILRCEKYTAAAAGPAASDLIKVKIINNINTHSDTTTKCNALNMLGKIFSNVASWPPETDSILTLQTGPLLYELAISLLQIGELLSDSEAAQFCCNDEFLADIVLPAKRNVETIGQLPYVIMKDFINLLQRSLARSAEIGGMVEDLMNLEPQLQRSISRNGSGSNELQYDRYVSSHEKDSELMEKYPGGSQRPKTLNGSKALGQPVPRHSFMAGHPSEESASTNTSRSAASNFLKNSVSHSDSESHRSLILGGIPEVPDSPEPQHRSTLIPKSKFRASQNQSLSETRRILAFLRAQRSVPCWIAKAGDRFLGRFAQSYLWSSTIS